MTITEINNLQEFQQALKYWKPIISGIADNQRKVFNSINTKFSDDHVICLNAELLSKANTMKNCILKCIDLDF